jgi:parallel beta-helix repeat protein
VHRRRRSLHCVWRRDHAEAEWVHHDRLRRNRLSGNGYAAQGSNFGIGLVAAADHDNVIEDNTILGNTNGIILAAGVSGNIFRRNVVAGNPPVQVSNSFPADNGVDIRNSATPGANTFENNICLTSPLRQIRVQPTGLGAIRVTDHARCMGPTSQRSFTRSARPPGVSVDPQAYLLHAVSAAIARPGATTFPEDLPVVLISDCGTGKT